jgi:hypothetical protein
MEFQKLEELHPRCQSDQAENMISSQQQLHIYEIQKSSLGFLLLSFVLF